MDNQSIASAMFEALEHYYSCPITYKRSTYKLKVSELFNQDNLAKEYPIAELYKNYPDLNLDCENYKKLNSSTTQIMYPAFLSHPYFSEEKTNNSKYKLFATNNGTATGLNLEEAILHGVNELIERDAISLHLIKAFLSKNPNIYVVDDSTIPNRLKEILKICKQIIKDVLIVDITSDFNVPSYLVVGRIEGKILPVVGSGASLSSEYALERAMLEIIQSLHLHDEELENEDLEIIKRIEKFEPLLNALFLSYKTKDLIYINFVSISPESILIKEQLIELQKKVSQLDYNIYYNILKKSENFYCVKTIIPGLEKFHLVRGGAAVPLSSRGIKYKRALEGSCIK